MEDGVMLAREKSIDAHAGLRRELPEASAFELMGDEREALLLGELFQGGGERFEENRAGISRLGPGVGRGQPVFERADGSVSVLIGIRNWRRRARRLSPLPAKPVDDPISRDPEQPGTDLLDGFHEALRLDELEEDVLQHVLNVLAVRHALPDEVAQTAALALDRLGDSPVLLAHLLLEDQDCPPLIDGDG